MTPTSASDDQEVRDAFVRWASLQAGAPRGSDSLIEHIDITHEHVGLLDTDVQGRRAVWKSIPVSARSRATIPAVALDDVDPWSVEPVSLRERSVHIAVCAVCAGEKKVRCALCAGSGKTLCGACNGQRKAYGHAANGAYRLLNCTTCRGKGQLDCALCRRGIATCAECAGEGRLQRWVEIENWHRSVANVHPSTIAPQFAWSESPANEAIARDAEVRIDIDRPYRLAPPDLRDVPAQWLEFLGPELMPGERVARQRLRIVRVPTYSVEYRLGADEDRVSFTGLRLLAPHRDVQSAFARRIAKLRSLGWLLIATGIVIAIVSLGRGAFFWSLWTFLSLLASGVALVAMYVAATDWTAARRNTRRWLITTAASLALAIAFALASLPRIGHAQRLIAADRLEDAESELRALGDKADTSTWADLRLARVRVSMDVAAARHELVQIPGELPQHAVAANAIDELILRTAHNDAGMQRWSSASDALALLSPGARERSEIVVMGTTVYVPLATQKIAAADWPGAANVVLAARRLGVAPAALEPLTAAILAAGIERAAKAKRQNDVRSRLRLRLAAEEIFVSWERATDAWGTPSLIELRTSMARDVAAAERSERRRRAS